MRPRRRLFLPRSTAARRAARRAARYCTEADRPVGGLMYARDDMTSIALPVVVFPARAGIDLPAFLIAPTVSVKLNCGLKARNIAASPATMGVAIEVPVSIW